MTGIIRVLNGNNTFLNDPSSSVAAFVNGEIRGVVDNADIIFVNGGAYFPMSIYANQTQGEALDFKVYIGSIDSIFTPSETAIFDRSESLGYPAAPFLLNISLCNDVLILTEANIPFRSFYKAGQEIILEGPLSFTQDSLGLSAPQISIYDNQELVNSQSVILIDSIGCN